MNILDGIKPNSHKNSNQTITKFIIKSRPSLKQNKVQPDFLDNKASYEDVQQFLSYMLAKSTRFKDLIEQQKISDLETFVNKHVYGSICIKTMLKGILEKMLSERRLGKNLKGMNKSLLQQIQNHIWNSMERQASLFLVNKKYQTEKDQLKEQLAKRKRQIQNEFLLMKNDQNSQQCLKESINIQERYNQQ